MSTGSLDRTLTRRIERGQRAVVAGGALQQGGQGARVARAVGAR